MPTEIENQEVELPDELEIEVVDDTPPADQNRKDLPAKVAAVLPTLDEDDLDGDVEEVREKAREKLKLAKKAWHDERRGKEEAQRLAAEATNLVKSYQTRTVAQAQQLVTGEQYLIAQMQDKVKKEIALAKDAYKKAYESGDSDALAEAQEVLSRATANAMQVEQWKPTQQNALQELQNEVQRQPQAVKAPEPEPTFDAKAQSWAQRNPWYGQDLEMTNLAQAVHVKLVNDGVDPTSDEYYAKIDKRVREKFPENFSNQQPATVVASVQRSARGNKVTLTQTQVSLAKRLGLTNEQYARSLLELRGQA